MRNLLGPPKSNTEFAWPPPCFPAPPNTFQMNTPLVEHLASMLE